MARIQIFNPNSSTAVTADVEDSVGRAPQNLHTIICTTNPEGPLGIETDAHTQQVIPQVIAAMTDDSYDIGVVACFSDPGVHQARAATSRPVLGIAESAYLNAAACGERFGIASIVAASVVRHARHLEQLGLSDRVAGDRPLDLGVSQLHGANAFDRLVEIGTLLRDQDGADCIVLGCAGLGSYGALLEETLGIPVIDPVQATVEHALALLDSAPIAH